MFADTFLGTLLAMVVTMLLMGRAHELTRGPSMAFGWLFAPKHGRHGCKCKHCKMRRGSHGRGSHGRGTKQQMWGRQLRLRRQWPRSAVKVAPPSVRPVTITPQQPAVEPAPLPAAAVAEFKWH